MKDFKVPFNGQTGHVYNGKQSGKLKPGPWFTFTAIKANEWSIKGQSPTRFYSWIKIDKNAKDEEKPEEDDDQPKEGWIHRGISVWHYSQIDGFDEKKMVAPEEEEPETETATTPAPAETAKPAVEPVAVEGLTTRESVIKSLIEHGRNVFLAGPAGCGKTYTCKRIAEILGLPFHSMQRVQTDFDLFGFLDANGVYHETEFAKAVKEGGIFLIDEIDASDESVLTALNTAMANRYVTLPTGRVELHPSTIFVATGNTVGRGGDGQYTGRRVLDAATLDRFFILNCDYEEKVQASLFGAEISDFLNAVRSAFKLIGCEQPVTYRAGHDLKEMVGIIDDSILFEGVIWKGLSEDTKVQVKTALNKSKNNLVKRLVAAA